MRDGRFRSFKPAVTQAASDTLIKSLKTYVFTCVLDKKTASAPSNEYGEHMTQELESKERRKKRRKDKSNKQNRYSSLSEEAKFAAVLGTTFLWLGFVVFVVVNYSELLIDAL